MSNQVIYAIFIGSIAITGIRTAVADEYGLEDPDLNYDADVLEDFVAKAREYQRREIENPLEEWHGRWFPGRSSDPTPPPKIYPSSGHQQDTGSIRIPMGVKLLDCDDGKTNLTVDWDNSPVNYTCYGKKMMPDTLIKPLLYCTHIPKYYVAIHKCMYDVIEYDDNIPLYGTHRPIWPVYGEYKFVPKQRWIHNLEHGAVVMLYHPCANPLEVERLRNLVTGCLRRYIITPYDLLDLERPLALVTWGCRLTMPYVDRIVVQEFIVRKALKGPEAVARDGDFDHGLLKKAAIVSDFEDSILCPKYDSRSYRVELYGDAF